MIAKYKIVLVLLVSVSLMSPVFLLLLQLPILGRDYIERARFYEGHYDYNPYKNALPWEVNALLNEVDSLAPKNNLVLLGSSSTRAGVIYWQMKLPPGWKLTNLGMSRDTVYSFRIMRNYLNNYANHKLDKSDVLVLDVNFLTFALTPQTDDWLRHTLGLFGFQVDDMANVYGKPISRLYKQLKFAKYRAYLAFGKDKGSIANFLYSELYDLADYRFHLVRNKEESYGPNTITPERIERATATYSDWTKDLTFPGQSTEDFKQLLKDLRSQTNVVVVDMYVPSWLRDLPVEQDYEKWVQTGLLPFLKDEGIPYLGFSISIPDSEYGDPTHLFYKGRERFTREFNSAINPILSSLSSAF